MQKRAHFQRLHFHLCSRFSFGFSHLQIRPERVKFRINFPRNFMAVFSNRHCFCSKIARITALIIKNTEIMPIIVNIFFIGFYPPINLHFSKKTSKHGISRSKTALNIFFKTLNAEKVDCFFSLNSIKSENSTTICEYFYIFRPAPIYGIL